MSLRHIVSNIRFWIIIFFTLRLFAISNPPLEGSHNWRQTTVTMVSRNFLEVDNNILYPRIDIAGEKNGITGMEFPLLNYLIYIFSELFGYQHWYGRLINLIISSFGLWYFYRLVKKYFLDKTAFYATIILSVSIWFQFSRKIMPDTFSMSFIIASIYYGSNYMESMSKKYNLLNLISYFLLMVMGVLSKLPTGYLLIVFGIFFLNKNISLQRKLTFTGVSIMGLIPVCFWYFYWVPYLVEKFGFWHFFMGKGLEQGLIEITQNISLTLKRFYDTALKYSGFGLFLFGLILSIYKKEKLLITLFIITFLSFCIVILKSGLTFSLHSYYIIPFVPIMALIAGYGLSNIKSQKFSLLILLLISIEGVANQQDDFWINENQKGILELEKDLDKVCKRSDLIFINSGNFPTPMYFSHHKGWVDSNEKIIDKDYQKELITKGLKYIVILKRSFGTEVKLEEYKKVLENVDYAIYETANTGLDQKSY